VKLKILFTLTLPSPYRRGKYFVGDGVLAQHAEVTRCERPAIYHCLIQNSEQNIFCEIEDSFHPHPTLSQWAREIFRRGRRPCAARRGYEVRTSRGRNNNCRGRRPRRPAIYHCLIQNSEQNIFCEIEDSFHSHPTLSHWAREIFRRGRRGRRPAIYHCLIQNSEQNIFCEI